MNIVKEFFDKELLFSILGKLFVALIILVIGVMVTHFVIKTLQKLLFKGPENQKKKTLFTVFSSLAKYVIYFITLVSVLEVFGVPSGSVVAIASVGSVAVGFGAQALVKDIISGLFILTENQYNVDDVIEIADYTGTVEEMSLRTTILRTAKGEQCIIPNGEIRAVKNYSRDYMKAFVEVPVPYEKDLDEVIKLLETHLSTYYVEGSTLSNPEIVGMTDFGDSAVMLRVACVCVPGKNWGIERELRKMIKKIFDDHGIEIPFNTTTVHLVNENKN